MKAIKISAYCFVFLVAGLLFFLFLTKKLNDWGFVIAMLILIVFAAVVLNLDRISKLKYGPSPLSLTVEMLNTLNQSGKDVTELKQGIEEFKRDLAIHVTDTVSVSERIDVVVMPKVIKLENTIKKAESLATKAEKLLAGKIEAKSDLSGKLEVKKREGEK